MPRTKVTTKLFNSPNLSAEQKKDVNSWLTKWKSDYEQMIGDLDENYNKTIEEIEAFIKIEKQNYPSSIGKKTLAEMRCTNNTTFFDNTSNLLSSTSNILSSTQKSNISTLNSTNAIRKPALKKNKHSDEGYLTAESTRAASSDRCRGRSPTKTNKARHSRSLSRSRLPDKKNVKIQLPSPITRCTPDRRMPAPGCYGFITPKHKPNTPLTVLRRPKQGEMAISMQGSPLLVNGIITEACANINIPLEDGRVLSLQPSKNIRMSQLPAIPDGTRQQLAKLRDHLNQVCGYAEHSDG